jgi:hypothetical protein
MGMVVEAANGDYGADANHQRFRVQSLSPRQIERALEAAKRWQQTLDS